MRRQSFQVGGNRPSFKASPMKTRSTNFITKREIDMLKLQQSVDDLTNYVNHLGKGINKQSKRIEEGNRWRDLAKKGMDQTIKTV